jgi:ketosteroid isomerase-like protein
VEKPPPRIEAELLAANQRFYEAFEMLNLDAMDAVWADAIGVSCIHPGGPAIHGREAVMRSWAQIFEGTDEMVFQLDKLELAVVGTTGWVTLVERIEQRNEGRLVKASALATNVFVHQMAGWRMVHHHASAVRISTPSAAPPGPKMVN